MSHGDRAMNEEDRVFFCTIRQAPYIEQNKSETNSEWTSILKISFCCRCSNPHQAVSFQFPFSALLPLSYRTVPLGTKRRRGIMAGGTTWREMEERDTLGRGLVVWERKHTWNKLNINTASSSSLPWLCFYALSEIGLGCFGHWQPSLGRLVDPFLMYNDGFMSRISPLEDFGRLWKGSKWPIGIQIRRSGGESRFIFFLVAGQYHRTFTLFRY